MKHSLSSVLSVLLVLFVGVLIFPANLSAQVVKLAWEQSASTDVAGYKIYYKAASSELPLDGIEALEGPSPIDVGNTTSCTLSELPEGYVYYFRASAYDSTEQESELSNLATSKWIPATLAPNISTEVGSQAILVWSAPPENLTMTFTVIYGTDPKLTKPAKVENRGRRWQKKYLEVWTPPIKKKRLTDNCYTIDNLDPETTYYWRVIAKDENGQRYKSCVSSFVTEEIDSSRPVTPQQTSSPALVADSSTLTTANVSSSLSIGY